MKSFNYTITDEIGLHARPAGLLVKEVKTYQSTVSIKCNGKSADASKLMAIMALGVKKSDVVTIDVTGEDEVEAAGKLEAFFKANL